MICPKCKLSHKCGCSNCVDKNKLIGGHFLVVEDSLGVCQGCGYRFEMEESMDVEWEIMMENLMETIMTKENLLEYLESKFLGGLSHINFLKKHLEYENDHFVQRCFYSHFGIAISKVSIPWMICEKRKIKLENIIK